MGEFLILWAGLQFFLKEYRAAFILLVIGLITIAISKFQSLKRNAYMNDAGVDRSYDIVDEVGGADNIDINLSKYGDNSQLLVLKDRRILVGYDDYDYKEFISFDSILEVDVRVDRVSKGTAYENSENTIRQVIRSITVYIHLKEHTKELYYRYDEYDYSDVQRKYNEIIKGLQRLKVLLGDYSDIESYNEQDDIRPSIDPIPQRIKGYKELLDMGAITEEEYEIKKKQLLNQ